MPIAASARWTAARGPWPSRIGSKTSSSRVRTDRHREGHEGEADGRPQPARNDQEVGHDRNRDGEEGAAALAEERELDEGSRGEP